MTQLAGLQRDFARYLLDGAGSGMLAGAVRVPPGIDAGARLGVYRFAYGDRLHETLRNDYPVLLRLVGAGRFAALAAAYAAAHPSRSPNIRWFGQVLPAFMAGDPAWRQDEAACAMAGFEWQLGLAFDAADAEPLAFDDLAAVPAADWAGLRFTLHPSLRWLALTHAVAGWWLAVRDLDDDASLPPAPQRLPEAERYWAVWRGSDGVRFRQIETDEAAALSAVQSGAGFGALCEGLAEHVGADDAAPRAAGLLRLWVDAGWIAGCSTAGA